MPSERIQRQIVLLLDEAGTAMSAGHWPAVAEKARAVLAIDEANEDAAAFLKMAAANPATSASSSVPSAPPASAAGSRSTEQPVSFAGGRYEVRRFLGEGGKKRVFLAHDVRLDRDVAFALIKTEGLDAVGRERIEREAQAMGRLGAHPHIVTIFEIGEEAAPGGSGEAAPYVVTELMGGGDVEGLLEKAGGPLDLPRALEIAKGVARGLAFAHAQGIVHRDLKPGNVWLTADGVAKIGDFGLAVALDRSRLTMHGLMVGTVAYMPPEQALGGAVTPQADLYSLGAMLYELVTGKPPFQADDPTAVISQHINTPPVAPSWHSERCPPDLEALILRMLQKAPADRPQDAAEVLAALEAVDPAARSASHSGASANPLERLARGVFVGRERELTRLRAAFDEAFAGRGGVVMLVGEPGIGKTRTVQELSTYARTRGGRVIWGASHEAAGAPPYRPWVQAGDHYARQFGLDGIDERLQPQDASELSRIFPGLRAQPNYVPPLEVSDPDVAQFRLFEAYAHLLGAYSTDMPLLVVLDDLHWADKPTLLLLRHVARELGRTRVLLVGTYRDTELGRTHPLSETLAELNRGDGFTRINLAGLTRDEVGDYIRTAAQVEPPREHVDRIFEETEGNPFFLTEVVNLLAQERTLSNRSTEIQVPEGVREALGRRLDRLSEAANALFQYAAVAGRQFAYDTLHLVTEHSDDALLRLIEEGLAARVIEEAEQAGRYRFTHALMQETLLQELSTTRRARMHGEVGEAIEARLGDRAGEQAPRLARHFTESATLNESHAAKAAHYSRIAGEHAEAQAAWAEAARHYENCVELMHTAGGGLGQDEAWLRLALGRSQWAGGGDPRQARQNQLLAIDLYRERGDDWIGLANATLQAAMLFQVPAARLTPMLTTAIEAPGARNPVLEAQLRARRALLLGHTEPTREDIEFAERVGREHKLPGVLGDLEAYRADEAGWSGRLDEAAEHCRLAAELRFQSGDFHGQMAALLVQATTLMTVGKLDAALFVCSQMLERAQTTHNVFFQHFAAPTVVLLGDLRRGNLKAAAEAIEPTFSGDQLMSHLVRIALAEFDGTRPSGAALDGLLAPMALGGGVPYIVASVHAVHARAYLIAGDRQTATDHLAEWARAFRAWLEHPDSVLIAMVTFIGHVGDPLIEVGDAELQGSVYDFLAGHPEIRGAFGSVDRIRGALALRLNLVEDAARHFQAGVEWCARESSPIEQGRCELGLAEGAELRGDRFLAMQHLDRAGDLLSRHGAVRYLDQVLAKKDFLRA